MASVENDRCGGSRARADPDPRSGPGQAAAARCPGGAARDRGNLPHTPHRRRPRPLSPGGQRRRRGRGVLRADRGHRALGPGSITGMDGAVCHCEFFGGDGIHAAIDWHRRSIIFACALPERAENLQIRLTRLQTARTWRSTPGCGRFPTWLKLVRTCAVVEGDTPGKSPYREPCQVTASATSATLATLLVVTHFGHGYLTYECHCDHVNEASL